MRASLTAAHPRSNVRACLRSRNGIWVEVLSADALKQDVSGLQAISLADNLDQVHNMPEHEIEFFHRAWQKVHNCRTPSEFASVVEDLQQMTAGSWNERDCIQTVNVAKRFSREHMVAVQKFHFYYVNATVLRVATDFIGSFQSFPDTAQWCVVAMICTQYLSSEDTLTPTGRGFLAESIPKAKVKAIAKEGEKLQAVEALLKHMLLRTHQLSECDLTPSLLKAAGQTLKRAGTLLLKPWSQDEETNVKAMTEIEFKFARETYKDDVEKFQNEYVPKMPGTAQRFQDDVRKSASKSSRAHKVETVQVDVAPVLEYDKEGAVVDNAARVAYCKRGITIGGGCCARRLARTARKAPRVRLLSSPPPTPM